jgi:fatty-acyl-CoA synthase
MTAPDISLGNWFAALEPGQSLTLTQLREFAGQSLARFKMPTKLFVVPTLPRNPAGKISKVQLREEFRAG